MKKALIGALCALAVAAPASATTFVFTKEGTAQDYANNKPFTQSVNGLTATLQAFTYNGGASLLGNMSQLTDSLTRVTSVGTGVKSTNDANTQQSQIDSFGTNEALLVNLAGGIAGSLYSISSLLVNHVDQDDTVFIYGVRSNGQLDKFGFSRNIANAKLGTDGFTSVKQSDDNDGTYFLNEFSYTAPQAGYTSFLFTNYRDVDAGSNGDGFRFVNFSVSAVPEPELWAMLIVGFGLVGMQMRRRSGLATVSA